MIRLIFVLTAITWSLTQPRTGAKAPYRMPLSSTTTATTLRIVGNTLASAAARRLLVRTPPRPGRVPAWSTVRLRIAWGAIAVSTPDSCLVGGPPVGSGATSLAACPLAADGVPKPPAGWRVGATGGRGGGAGRAGGICAGAPCAGLAAGAAAV